jgi:hypothetical protein
MGADMSIFGTIMDKIFHHAAAQPTQAPAVLLQTASPSPAPAPEPAAASEAAPTVAAPTQPVDVEAVLSEMASLKNGGGNYQTSIVDLLNLLDLDSSLAARKALADELNVHAGEAGSAEENLALHKTVMDKLAKNGGVVPDNLRS